MAVNWFEGKAGEKALYRLLGLRDKDEFRQTKEIIKAQNRQLLRLIRSDNPDLGEDTIDGRLWLRHPRNRSLQAKTDVRLRDYAS